MNDSTGNNTAVTPTPACPPSANVDDGALNRAQERSQNHLFSMQDPEGFWVDELESNVSMTAEVVYFYHMMEIEPPEGRIEKIVNYLLRLQQEDGGWTMFPDNPSDISYTVEAYVALKMSGVSADRPEMLRAREFILNNGGVRSCRVFTWTFLALLGEMPWESVPPMPVELMLLPNGAYFSIYEMSSWSRSTVVPLIVVYAYQMTRPLEKNQTSPEIFTEADRNIRFPYSGKGLTWGNFFVWLSRVIEWVGKCPWKPLRRHALKKAKKWLLDHQEPEGDFGGIQPPMIYSPLAYKCLGYKNDDPEIVLSLEALDRFILDFGDHCAMQACVSPLWDTALSGNALIDSGVPADHPKLVQAAEWIYKKQVTSYKGDWRVKNPHTPPGGWAFEFYNQLYPDCDDTAEILMFLQRVPVADNEMKEREIQRAVTWLLSMQSSNGGWAAFDQDNDNRLFNEIPFADLGAMLDPPTVDVTGRILWGLGFLGFKEDHPRVKRAIDFVKSEQEADGCWWGRWGVNYIYGTWLVLEGLRGIGQDMEQSYIRRAAKWLTDCQNPDGGWGETCLSYRKPELRGQGVTTASQTAWAVMGLMAAGETDSEAVRRGVRFLVDTQNEDGSWWEKHFTGTGFPAHFFLKYHMYSRFFPLMALAQYQKGFRPGQRDAATRRGGRV